MMPLPEVARRRKHEYVLLHRRHPLDQIEEGLMVFVPIDTGSEPDQVIPGELFRGASSTFTRVACIVSAIALATSRYSCGDRTNK